MEKYGVNELRKMFLDYFEKQGHLRMNSFSLVPQNDKSLLIINAGMAPLKPYFTGQEEPPRRRVTTCQKCIRTGDIDNIGKTARHGTFFEMLGNFSFGDYFKSEAIHWAWEFLTKVVGLPEDRLYPSIYLDDEEAFEVWTKQEHIDPSRIYRFGKEDNFWEHGSGPCGPCSEIYYDRGEKYGTGPENVVGGDGDRFMEVWNIVFTQFNNDGHGNYTKLIQKNIDTGMGLERLAVAVQDVDSIFDVDTLRALTEHVGEITGTRYKEDPVKDVSIRIITDHIRSVTFMISDGIMPSNNGRGYVLRRLLRRAARHGRLLGVHGTFLANLAQTVIDTSKDGYPELEEKKEVILRVITEEENKFNRTIDQGLAILKDVIDEVKAQGSTMLSGANAFRLYDTYGFPRDLTEEILRESGLSMDSEGFDLAKDQTVYDEVDPALKTAFVGYGATENESVISVLISKSLEDASDYGAISETLEEGESGAIIVPESVFYATMGGQESDRGLIEGPEGLFRVREALHLTGGTVAHIGTVESGSFTRGDKVSLKADRENRENTCENHSATHLLQKALRVVLGTHVEQAGSLNNADRLRFDFTHFQAMSADEIRRVEELVNEEIKAALPVVTKEMSVDEARKMGAMALFGEKYGSVVRVVSMGDFSIELCGGTHVSNTRDIGTFKILSESGISAGVRRIEAITGDRVLHYYKRLENELKETAASLKTSPAELPNRIRSLQEELKRTQAENEELKAKIAAKEAKDVLGSAETVGDFRILTKTVQGMTADEMRTLADTLKDKLGDGLIVLASVQNGAVTLLAAATDGAVKRGAHAGNIIKNIAPLVKGGGGGRPNMAQAGGKDPSGIDAAFLKAREVFSEQVK